MTRMRCAGVGLLEEAKELKYCFGLRGTFSPLFKRSSLFRCFPHSWSMIVGVACQVPGQRVRYQNDLFGQRTPHSSMSSTSSSSSHSNANAFCRVAEAGSASSSPFEASSFKAVPPAAGSATPVPLPTPTYPRAGTTRRVAWSRRPHLGCDAERLRFMHASRCPPSIGGSASFGVPSPARNASSRTRSSVEPPAPSSPASQCRPARVACAPAVRSARPKQRAAPRCASGLKRAPTRRATQTSPTASLPVLVGLGRILEQQRRHDAAALLRQVAACVGALHPRARRADEPGTRREAARSDIAPTRRGAGRSRARSRRSREAARQAPPPPPPASRRCSRGEASARSPRRPQSPRHHLRHPASDPAVWGARAAQRRSP